MITSSISISRRACPGRFSLTEGWVKYEEWSVNKRGSQLQSRLPCSLQNHCLLFLHVVRQKARLRLGPTSLPGGHLPAVASHLRPHPRTAPEAVKRPGHNLHFVPGSESGQLSWNLGVTTQSRWAGDCMSQHWFLGCTVPQPGPWPKRV